MKKKQSEKRKVAGVFLLILFAALVSDFAAKGLLQGDFIQRGDPGEKEQAVELELSVDGVLEEYPYSFEVEATAPTKEEADAFIEKTIQQIEKDFTKIEERVPLKKTYFDDAVKADWSFLPFGLISSDGTINREKLQSEETLVQAEVELTCGNYERVYTFPFILKKPVLSETERVLEEIEKQLEEQMALEGSDKIQLPKTAAGKKVVWTEKKAYRTPQILFLEILALLFLWVLSRKKGKEDEKKRIAAMEEDYPDIVNELSLLLGAGMTTRQAWSRLGNLYGFKRNNKMIEERTVYEAILRMNGRFSEGESERAVYQKFCEEIPAACYHKLMRILLGNLEKGTTGICIRLEEESRSAFEQRIVLAKKRGEEASTKMLLPLMLMMMIVMGIVMLPALIEFQM